MSAFAEFDLKAELLRASLECAVPLAIDDLKRQGGPSDVDWSECKRFGDELAEKGDQLMFRTRGTTSRLWTGVARSLAVLAFCPGGVTFLGMHFEEPPEFSQQPAAQEPSTRGGGPARQESL